MKIHVFIHIFVGPFAIWIGSDQSDRPHIWFDFWSNLGRGVLFVLSVLLFSGFIASYTYFIPNLYRDASEKDDCYMAGCINVLAWVWFSLLSNSYVARADRFFGHTLFGSYSAIFWVYSTYISRYFLKGGVDL